MLAKLALLLHSKVAVAVVGAVLLSGTGAVAVAATQGKISLPGAATSHGAAATHTPASTAAAIHAHTVAIEGTLVSCGGATTVGKTSTIPGPGMICVTDAHGTTHHILVNVDTKINGDHALVTSDLSTLIGRKVEVNATAQSDGSLVAWKVTIEGGPSSDNGNNAGNGNGTHGNQGQHVAASGTIATLSQQGFSLTLAGGSTQAVTTSTATVFAGKIHQRSDLRAGMLVSVQGIGQADGSIAATRIEAA